MTTLDLTSSRAPDHLSLWQTRATASAMTVIAATGPAAIAAVRWLLPYDTTDGTAAMVEKISANPARETAVLWLTYLAVLALPIGVLLAGRLAIRTRPLLGTVAAALAWLGFGSLAASVTISDYAASAATTGHVPTPATVALLDSLAGLPPTAIATGVFVAGHILGAILLAIALRTVIPGWAALALAVSQPLHLVFAVLVPNQPLDAVAWALTGVGLAAAATANTRNDTGQHFHRPNR
jgi:hypothetical protein